MARNPYVCRLRELLFIKTVNYNLLAIQLFKWSHEQFDDLYSHGKPTITTLILVAVQAIAGLLALLCWIISWQFWFYKNLRQTACWTYRPQENIMKPCVVSWVTLHAIEMEREITGECRMWVTLGEESGQATRAKVVPRIMGIWMLFLYRCRLQRVGRTSNKPNRFLIKLQFVVECCI